MKLVLVILALAASSVAPWTQKQEYEQLQIVADCRKISLLSDELYAKVKNFEFPNEAPVREFLKCSAEKNEMFTTDKGFDVANLISEMQLAKNSKAADQVKGCVYQSSNGGKYDAQTVYNYVICIAKYINH